ncbi:hypothetical protein QBC38DRAFT_450440 [Podospora fimiseda]|uniref:LYR family protein n=1 Tax=Podospora fimiseda TaxID=252190 RepID=A0AAN7H8U5_9PEZI|nr:hypothetical protein QBC38DRAFT_450440 [Podospora fimiseda]
MAPLQPYRTATTTRRSARSGYPQEQDDFEGLPVRQWRRQWVSVAMTPPKEKNDDDDLWADDPSHGMPKESHLLAPYMQELLKAARSINYGKRPAPDDDEDDFDSYVDKKEEEEEQQEEEGFMIQTWKQLPRTTESQTISHLAKRHKNTVTLSSKPGLPHISGPTITRATVRRIDAAGNPYEQTITLHQGQKVDGEIISTTIVPAPVPKAQDLELATQQPTPNRRKPPPPKRKPKGPGRGRKKKVTLAVPVPATRSQQQATGADGVKIEGESEDMSKLEDIEDSMMQDSEMADNSALQSDDDDDDDTGDQDDDTEGQDGPGNGVAEHSRSKSEVTDFIKEQSQDQDMLDLEPAEVVHPSSVEEPDDVVSPYGAGVRRGSSGEEELTIPKPRFQAPLGLSPFGPFGSPRVEGSPLKHVMTHSPTDGGSPSMDSPNVGMEATTMVAESYTSAGMHMDVDSAEAAVSEFIKMEQFEGEPVTAEAATESNGDATTTHAATAEIQMTEATAPAVPVQNEERKTEKEADGADSSVPAGVPQIQVDELETLNFDYALDAPSGVKIKQEEGEEDDDGPNLLGSLEAELDRQESLSNATGSRADTPKHEAVAPVVAEGHVAQPLASSFELDMAYVSQPFEEENKEGEDNDVEMGFNSGFDAGFDASVVTPDIGFASGITPDVGFSAVVTPDVGSNAGGADDSVTKPEDESNEDVVAKDDDDDEVGGGENQEKTTGAAETTTKTQTTKSS